jgi:crotonobetainyl-CoA:carnitine CoA-transferase CaiB-like acyl-CoA transferase
MKPLEGIRVVEIGQNLAIPYGAQILGGLGAEVVKIERQEGGDDCRAWGPPFVGDTATAFHSMNQGKKSVALDLKDPESLAWLKTFIGDSDIVMHNMRPGVMESYGLDGETLLAAYPKLIYAEVSGFGATGPMQTALGYDAVAQAVSGLFHSNGDPEGRPARLGPSVLDLGAGMWSVIGCMAALRERERTGKGTIVDTSLFETAFGFQSPAIANFSMTGETPERLRAGVPKVVPFEGFPTKDGEIIVAAANDRLFKRFMVAIGRPDLAEDPRLQKNAGRAENKGELIAAIEEKMIQKTTAEWFDILTEASLPCGPVNTLHDSVPHPQTQALKLLREQPDSGLLLSDLPIRMHRERVGFDRIAPSLGADTEAYFKKETD